MELLGIVLAIFAAFALLDYIVELRRRAANELRWRKQEEQRVYDLDLELTQTRAALAAEKERKGEE